MRPAPLRPMPIDPYGSGAGSVGVLPSFQSPGRVDLVLDVSGCFAP